MEDSGHLFPTCIRKSGGRFWIKLSALGRTRRIFVRFHVNCSLSCPFFYDTITFDSAVVQIINLSYLKPGADQP